MALAPSNKKLFIGGVSWDTTDESFRAYFEQFGELEDSVVMRDQEGKARGFGFVVFRDGAGCDKVLSAGTLSLDGREIEAKRAVPKGETFRGPRQPMGGYGGGGGGGPPPDLRCSKIFIGGVPPDMTSKHLEAYFAKYGNVTDAVVMTHRDTGRPRGFGFVTYEQPRSVDKVMEDGREHVIEGKMVEIKRSIPRGYAPPPSGGLRGRGPPGAWGGREDFGGPAPRWDGPPSRGGGRDGWGYEHSRAAGYPGPDGHAGGYERGGYGREDYGYPAGPPGRGPPRGPPEPYAQGYFAGQGGPPAEYAPAPPRGPPGPPSRYGGYEPGAGQQSAGGYGQPMDSRAPAPPHAQQLRAPAETAVPYYNEPGQPTQGGPVEQRGYGQPAHPQYSYVTPSRQQPGRADHAYHPY